MTAAQIVGLLSAVSGAVGTLFLFFGSFAYEQLSPYSNPEIIRDIAKRNKRRQFRQGVGLGLLMLSFVLAGFNVVLNWPGQPPMMRPPPPADGGVIVIP